MSLQSNPLEKNKRQRAPRIRRPRKTTDRIGSNELGIDLGLVPESRLEVPQSRANVGRRMPPRPSTRSPRVTRKMLLNEVNKKKMEICSPYKGLSRKTMAELRELL